MRWYALGTERVRRTSGLAPQPAVSALLWAALGLLAAPAFAQDDPVVIGLRLFFAGDHERAFQQFGQALAKDPTRAVAVAGLAAVHLARGETQPALSSFAAAVELALGQAWPLACLGSAQLQSGNAAAAAASYRQALTARPEWAAVRARLAYALYCVGQTAAALDNARTAARYGESRVAPLVQAAAMLRDGDAHGALQILSGGRGLVVASAGPAGPALRMVSLASGLPGLGTSATTTAAPPAPRAGGVRIGWPRDGSSISGQVEIQADFDTPPTYSVLYIDDQFVSVTNASQVRMSWDTRRWPDGVHRVRVDAYDSAGRCTGRQEIQVIVANRERTSDAAQVARDATLGMALAEACLPAPPPWDPPLLYAEAARLIGRVEAALDAVEYAFCCWPWHDGLRQELHLACRDLGWANPVPAEILVLPRPGQVAVTFDDGPHPRITPWLLDVLAKRRIKATFFLVGQQAVQYPEIVRAIVDRGHEVAVHSYTHRNMTRMAQAEIERELAQSRWAIARACGQRPRLFRPPGGHYSGDVRAAAAVLGFRTVFWNANICRYYKRTLQEMVEGLDGDLTKGGILLLHNGEDETPLIVEQLLDRLRARGCELGPVGQLSGVEAAHLDTAGRAQVR